MRRKRRVRRKYGRRASNRRFRHAASRMNKRNLRKVIARSGYML